jgi:hypothetical protein
MAVWVVNQHKRYRAIRDTEHPQTGEPVSVGDIIVMPPGHGASGGGWVYVEVAETFGGKPVGKGTRWWEEIVLPQASEAEWRQEIRDLAVALERAMGTATVMEEQASESASDCGGMAVSLASAQEYPHGLDDMLDWWYWEERHA